MLEAAGAKDIRVQAKVEMRQAIHELGRAHGERSEEVCAHAFKPSARLKNVFVMDGDELCVVWMPDDAHDDAVTVRACAHLIDSFRRSEI